ncbi:MAG TPA: hypothetical protein P5228_10470 [Bacteroidales bacterium]|nr:hypothetical protein [Bacteroidales bacterium]HRZ48285.1 hypothetical protein [Bacteroidales bacterium]
MAMMPSDIARSRLYFAAVVLLPLVFLMLSATSAFGQETKEEGMVMQPASRPAFTSLWNRQLTLSVGVLGYRRVEETDLFSVRHFNPDGSDFTTSEIASPSTKQYMFAVATAAVRYHRLFPLLTQVRIPLHFESSADLFLQKIVMPSMAMNRFTIDSGYSVHYSNLPLLASGEMFAGIWMGERVSFGASGWYSLCHVKTSDDRVVQRKYTLRNAGIAPYIRLWFPLESAGLQRWSVRLEGSAYNLWDKEAPFRALKTEVAFFRLSTEKSGRAAGFFFRTLHHFAVPTPMELSSSVYAIHSDVQYVLGFSIGTGGLNRKGGK